MCPGTASVPLCRDLPKVSADAKHRNNHRTRLHFTSSDCEGYFMICTFFCNIAALQKEARKKGFKYRLMACHKRSISSLE